MSKEIVNRVANSKIITIDLEDYYPNGQRHLLDMKNWLYKGLVLREKEFRSFVDNFEWAKFND